MCRVDGVIGTEIHFALWLPDAWNGKFEDKWNVDGVYEDRHEYAAAGPFGGFILDPAGSHRGCRPQDDDASSVGQGLLNRLAERLSTEELTVPPHRPALVLESRGNPFGVRPIRTFVTDEYFGHRVFERDHLVTEPPPCGRPNQGKKGFR
jgi:hypothetical protein